MNHYKVAVNYPVKNGVLTYSSSEDINPGQIVTVPLGKRSEVGVVLKKYLDNDLELEKIDFQKIKNIISIEPKLFLTENELELYNWISNYYHYSLGKLIFDSLPNILKNPKKLIITQTSFLEANKIIPNEKQKIIVEEIGKNLKTFHKFLLHGVTGSGKTIVYSEIINRIIETNKSVLFLIPEINLTSQFVKTFSEQIKAPLLLYHSEITDSQKFQIWNKAQEMSGPFLLLGVRSSIFVPISNLGLIIVDEEHDNSYKQEDRCPYNARDVAIKKAQLLNIPVLLGSATPSLETYFSFKDSKFSPYKFILRERAQNSYLPKINLVDAREKTVEGATTWPLTTAAVSLVEEALKRGEQVLVFINRLGYASYVQCRSCGHQFHCPNCSVVLRHYKKKNQLACHHCEYKENLPEQCTSCGCLTIIQKGFGTEKVKEVLELIFPNKRIERFDRDEIKSIKELDLRINDFHAGYIDVLVGTQMLSKGHNFKRVKLVLILGIDAQMNFPDFRSMERVYQTLTQVSGRAGRYSQDGIVAIQTQAPDNEIFEIVKTHDFDKFYTNELELRKNCSCSPFFRMATIHFSSRFQDKLIDHILNVVSPLIKSLIQTNFAEVRLLGPRPALVEKKSNQFTWTVLLKSSQITQLHNLLKSIELNYKRQSSISYKIDVDPYNIA